MRSERRGYAGGSPRHLRAQRSNPRLHMPGYGLLHCARNDGGMRLERDRCSRRQVSNAIIPAAASPRAAGCGLAPGYRRLRRPQNDVRLSSHHPANGRRHARDDPQRGCSDCAGLSCWPRSRRRMRRRCRRSCRTGRPRSNSPTTTTCSSRSRKKALKWEEPAEPVRIVGPIYFVGTKGLGVFLFTTSEGHILMNTGHALVRADDRRVRSASSASGPKTSRS